MCSHLIFYFLLDGVNRRTLRMQALSLTFSSLEKKIAARISFPVKGSLKSSSVQRATEIYFDCYK